jgi:hypothetical protein
MEIIFKILLIASVLYGALTQLANDILPRSIGWLIFLVLAPYDLSLLYLPSTNSAVVAGFAMIWGLGPIQIFQIFHIRHLVGLVLRCGVSTPSIAIAVSFFIVTMAPGFLSNISPPAASAFTPVSWLQPVGIVGILGLAIGSILYFLLIDGTRKQVPKGKNGLIPALALHILDIHFSPTIQRLIFGIYIIFFGDWDRIMKQDATLSTATWLCRLPPAVPYGATFVTGSLFHPLYRFHRLGRGATPNVWPQALGSLWFLGGYPVLAIMRAASALVDTWVQFAMKSLVGVSIVLFIFLACCGYFYDRLDEATRLTPQPGQTGNGGSYEIRRASKSKNDPTPPNSPESVSHGTYRLRVVDDVF